MVQVSVHTAPTFGADDARVAKMAQPEIPPMLVKDDNDNLVPLVDLQGKFIQERMYLKFSQENISRTNITMKEQRLRNHGM